MRLLIVTTIGTHILGCWCTKALITLHPDFCLLTCRVRASCVVLGFFPMLLHRPAAVTHRCHAYQYTR